MIELLIVLVMAGILLAIAAPGWLGFSRTQRASAARETVQQSLRQAQSKAQKSRLAQTVQFSTTANPPTVTGSDGIQALAERPGMVGLTAKNGSTSITEVKFGPNGNVIAPVMDVGGIKITASAPSSGGAKRCVIIQTLLGAMRPGTGSECD